MFGLRSPKYVIATNTFCLACLSASVYRNHGASTTITPRSDDHIILIVYEHASPPTLRSTMTTGNLCHTIAILINLTPPSIMDA